MKGRTRWTPLGLTVNLLWAVAVVVLSGCGSGGSESSVGTPNISLPTTLLDFGDVVKNNFADRSITIQNTGTATLDIGQIGLPSPPFQIAEDNCSRAALSVSSTCSIKVRFSPVAPGDFTGTFDITSNDSDQNALPISLRGSATDYGVSISRVDKSACSSSTLHLLVSVVDDTGAPVTGLIQNDFKLFENLNEIGTFTFSPVPATDPLSASLVLDYSFSTIPITTEMQEAAKVFVNALQTGVDEAEVIKFDQEIFTIDPGFTTDKGALILAIDSDFPGGDRAGTSLYDAIVQSIDETSKRVNVKRAVIAMSDGRDSGSTATLAEVINLAVQQGIPVFTISVGTDGAEPLQQLAKESGGQYFLANTSSDLQAVYLKISEILSNHYLITYPTGSSGGDTVSIRVEVDNSGLRGSDSRDVPGC